jgi:hypothetical protein
VIANVADKHPSIISRLLSVVLPRHPWGYPFLTLTDWDTLKQDFSHGLNTDKIRIKNELPVGFGRLEPPQSQTTHLAERR